MNLLRMPTIIFIGLLVLIAERVYFFNTTASRTTPEQQGKPASPDEQYARYAKPAQNIYGERNLNTFDGDTQKLVIHSTDTSLEPALSRRSSYNDNPEKIWDRYSVQLPNLYWLNEVNVSGIDYSEKNARQMQYLAYDGDPLAQFVYAYILTKKIESDAVANNVSPDYAKQTRRIKEIRELHIKAAAKGIYPSASALSNIYMLPGIADQTESLAWALIASAMRKGDNQSLERICTEANNLPCTNEALAKALDRAKSYVKMYSFKPAK